MEGYRRDQYPPRGNAASTSQQSGGSSGSQHPPRGNAASTSQQSRGRFGATGGTNRAFGSGSAGGLVDESDDFGTNDNTADNTGRGRFGNTGQIYSPFGQTQQQPAQRNPVGGFGDRDENQTNTAFGQTQRHPTLQNPFRGSPSKASRQQGEDDNIPGRRGPERRRIDSRSQRISDEHDSEVTEQHAEELYEQRRSHIRRAGFEAQNQNQTNIRLSAAPRARNEGNMLSSDQVGSAAPQHLNQGGPLAQMPTVQQLAILQKWNDSLKETSEQRAMILAMVSELAHELGAKGAAPADMSAALSNIERKYEELDRDLGSVMSRGVRPSIVHSAGSEGRISYLPPMQRGQLTAAYLPAIPPAQGAMSAPTSGGNAGRARMPKTTRCCGIVAAASNAVRNGAPRANNQNQSNYRFRCVICNEAFRDQRRVFTHFTACVGKNGNPNGACWYDDPSIDAANLPDGLLEEVRK